MLRLGTAVVGGRSKSNDMTVMAPAISKLPVLPGPSRVRSSGSGSVIVAPGWSETLIVKLPLGGGVLMLAGQLVIGVTEG